MKTGHSLYQILLGCVETNFLKAPPVLIFLLSKLYVYPYEIIY
jgi:hypothetical protein